MVLGLVVEWASLHQQENWERSKKEGRIVKDRASCKIVSAILAIESSI